jgi:hypothetical protein
VLFPRSTAVPAVAHKDYVRAGSRRSSSCQSVGGTHGSKPCAELPACLAGNRRGLQATRAPGVRLDERRHERWFVSLDRLLEVL